MIDLFRNGNEYGILDLSSYLIFLLDPECELLNV